MTTTTPDHDPSPNGAALAAPCKRCGREDGYTPSGRSIPRRCHGYCSTCGALLWRLCRAHGHASYDAAHAAHPHHPGPQLLGVLATQARVWARQRALRDLAGPLITTAARTGYQPYPSLPLRYGAPLLDWEGAQEPPWRPAPWFRPLATEDAAAAA